MNIMNKAFMIYVDWKIIVVDIIILREKKKKKKKKKKEKKISRIFINPETHNNHCNQHMSICYDDSITLSHPVWSYPHSFYSPYVQPFISFRSNTLVGLGLYSLVLMTTFYNRE